jgi:hypothetical protein
VSTIDPADDRERRGIDPAVSQMLALMSTTIEEMRKAVSKVTDGYELMQRIIFGTYDAATNQKVAGVLDQLNDGKRNFLELEAKIDSSAEQSRLERVDTEKRQKRLALIVAVPVCITALRALGVPTDKIGDMVSSVVKIVSQ